MAFSICSLTAYQFEARAFLHRRKLNRSLGEFPNLLLRKLKAPELINKVVVEGQRPLVRRWASPCARKDRGGDW